MPGCLSLCLSGGARPGRLLLVLVVVIGLPATLSAQTASGPAETPPAYFAGAQFVDSRGCAFARAAVNGQTRWVPRLGADRQPVCGLTPSLAAAPAAPDAPGIAATPPAAPPAEAAAPAPVAPVAPAPAAAPAVSPPAVAQAPVQAPVQARPRQQRARTAAAAPTPAAPVAPAAPVVTPRPDFPTVPCPPGYPARGVICVERSVFEQIQTARATAHSPRATLVPAAPDAPPPGQTAGRYVQVGAFAVPSNAQNTIARLQSQGLPPVTRQARQRGRTLQLVLAGPFSSHAELRAALGTARAMGFSDAFIR